VSAVRGFARLRYAPTFERDFRWLAPDHQRAVEDCIRDLQREFIPNGRRWHAVDRAARPPIFTVDVYSNKSWKLSCHVNQDTDGPVLVLRRGWPSTRSSTAGRRWRKRPFVSTH
jgi:hypothetical protein